MSLSNWFKDYVYIPLGGNRKGVTRGYINLMIIFLLSGIWHGANWTFVIWGLFHGFFLLLEEFIPRLKKLPKVLSNIYALLVVTVGFVVFRADTISQGIAFIGKMFSGFNFSAEAVSLAVQPLTPFFIVMFVVAILCCGPLAKVTSYVKNLESTPNSTKKEKLLYGASFVLSVVVLGWCILRLAGGSYNPFIYFRF